MDTNTVVKKDCVTLLNVLDEQVSRLRDMLFDFDDYLATHGLKPQSEQGLIKTSATLENNVLIEQLFISADRLQSEIDKVEDAILIVKNFIGEKDAENNS